MKKIAVVGGGIAGLSTAFFLAKILEEEKKRGKEVPFEVDLIEAKESLGGLIKTYSNVQGFQWEAGPSVLITVKKETQELCKAIGIWDDLVIAKRDSRYQNILYNKKISVLPRSTFGFFKSNFFSWITYVYIMLDFFRKKRFLKKSDISIGDLIEHHFGKDFLFKTIGPLVNGVFSGNLYRMSAKMCFPQWWNYAQNWGSLSRGWWNERKKKTESSKGFKPDGGLVSPSKGMESLVQHIQDYLNKNRIRIICNAPLKHVILSNEEERNNRKKKHKLVYQHLEHEYDHVIFCIPPPILKRLFRSKRVDPVATSAINPFQTMDLNPVVMVTVAYSRYMSEIPKGFGTLVAPGENTPLLSIVMHSRIFPNKCVSGTEVLHGVIGGEYFPEWIDKSNQELENFMVSELRRIWNITDMPLFFDVNRHMFGMPQFHTGHRESLQKVYDEYPNSLGIHFGGATFWGSGINNAIKGGKKMAEEIQKSYNES